MTSTCFDPELAGLSLFCPDVDESITFSGAAEFRADGTMTSSVSIRNQALVPPSCYEALGECGAALGLLASCTPGNAGSCVCDSENASAPEQASYTIDGNLLVIVRAGVPEYSYYCRQGDTIRLRGVDQNGQISVVEFGLD
jgi:hypothetical protein